MEIVEFTKDRIHDVVQFELNLREEEDFYGWKIDQDYIESVEKSFDDKNQNAISFLAYMDGKVVGRVDCSLLSTHFDGSIKAYLDWICVLKRYRHQKVAQMLMQSLRSELKKRNVSVMVGLIAANEEAQRFYHNLKDAMIRDEGIWIDIK